MKAGTPGFVGDRLRQARVYRGLSRTELAECVGTSQPSITQYEKGRTSPGPTIFSAICKALDFEAGFFAKPAFSVGSAPVFYRSIQAATKGLRERTEGRLAWAAELAQLLEGYVNLPAVNLPEFDVPDDPAALSDERIEEIAGELRWRWQVGEGAISDLNLLLENNGIIVLRFTMGDAKQDALSWRNPEGGRPFVALSADKESAVRSRFDVAHELAHLVLHRRVSRATVMEGAHWKLMEGQAHRFAGAFLLPPRPFIASLPIVTLERLLQLKPSWKVSVGAMLFRTQKLGLVNKQQAAILWELYGRRRWKTREPLDDVLPPEQPRILRRAVELVVSHGVLSKGAIADALLIPTSEVEELVGLPSGFFTGDRVRVELKQNAASTAATRARALGGATVIPIGARRID